MFKHKRAVFNALDELVAKLGGTIAPEQIVKEARNVSSPLHDEFVWDNTEAARLYRIGTAKKLLRVYEVHIVHGKKQKVRQFYRVTMEPGKPKQYIGHRKVFADKDMTRRAAIEALAQFRRGITSLEPFPEYFADLIEACNVEIAKIDLSQKEAVAV